MTSKPGLDGFYPRRPNTRSEVGGMGFNDEEKESAHKPSVLQPSPQASIKRDTFQTPVLHSKQVAPQGPAVGLTHSELEDSLRSIDEEDATPSKPEKTRRRREKGDKKRWSRKRIIIWSVIAVIVIGLGVAGYVFVKGVLASNSIFKGDIFGLIQQRALKQDTNGRTNILVFGTSEDDEGGNHPGAYLTDSIMVISLDQTKKDAYMVSIPRDLWVAYGQSCYYGGNEGKINGLYQCYSDEGQDDATGSRALSEKISEVTGLTVQYYAHVNYGVVRDAVNAVGGIDVTIPDYDPASPGIYDPNFDWKCNNTCKLVYYTDGEKAHMDGEHALAFARARNSEGGYGLPRGNYDREKSQQLVLTALKDKAMSAGTLTNFVAVTSLIDAMGNSLRTNFETAEIRTLMSLGADIKTDVIRSIDLNNEDEPATTTGQSSDGQSIVQAVSGVDDYSSIVKYIHKQINSEPFMLEDAQILVLNGTGVAGQGKIASDTLSDMGFSTATPANAPTGEYASREVYARDAVKYPGTLKKLQSLYGTVNTTGIEKFGAADDIDFVVVIGKADQTAE